MLYCNYFVLLILAFSLTKNEVITSFLPILIAYLLVGIAGFLLNDLWDKEKDRIAGKPNITNHLTPLFLIGLIASILILGLALLQLVAVSITILLSILISFLILYSIPRIRLKEKGIWGAITDALYAHVIPELILLSFINLYLDFYFIPVFFILFNFGIGLKDILIHQLEDFENDKKSNVKTLATDNISLAKRIIEIVNLSLGPILITFLIELYLYSNQIPFLIFALLIGLLLIATWLISKTKKDNLQLRIYIICSSFFLGVLSLYYGINQLLLFLIHPYFISFVRSSIHAIYLRFIYVLKVVFGLFLLTILPLIINHFLFYTFLLFGRNLKEKPLYKKESEPNFITKIRRAFN
jgi:4-hydroxybenzoate polyprenyltransferase